MHGIIFAEMKEFVGSREDVGSWDETLEAAGLESKTYLSLNTYPDEELVSIVGTVAEETGEPVSSVVEAFGRFIAADLLQKYRVYVDDDWDVMDLLAETEDTIHRAVRLSDDDADPPELECRRVDDDVVIEYGSDLGLCRLGEGLIQGIAEQYGESLHVTQDPCMLEGASVCEIRVSRA